MKGALAQEEAGRKEDKEALEKSVNELGTDKAELQVKRPQYNHPLLFLRGFVISEEISCFFCADPCKDPGSELGTERRGVRGPAREADCQRGCLSSSCCRGSTIASRAGQIARAACRLQEAGTS